ncbi:MAG: hypothetical protein WDN00_10240 [Limisphaerales bacterium]
MREITQGKPSSAAIIMREQPNNLVQAQAIRDNWIFVDIKIIVIIDEFKSNCLTENYANGQHKSEANEKRKPTLRRKSNLRRPFGVSALDAHVQLDGLRITGEINLELNPICRNGVLHATEKTP